MELQARFHGVGVSTFDWLGAGAVGGTRATLPVRMLGREYGPRPARIETHDRRDVDDHIDDGAVGQVWNRRS